MSGVFCLKTMVCPTPQDSPGEQSGREQIEKSHPMGNLKPQGSQNPHHCEKWPLHSAWILLHRVAKRGLPLVGLEDFFFLWVLGKALLFVWFYKHNSYTPWASPVLHWYCQWAGQGLFCSSVLQWNAILPLCWPSLVFSLQEPPHSQEATNQQLPVRIFKYLCFLTPHLLNKNTKSIHEHTACLNIFVAIKYMKKMS